MKPFLFRLSLFAAIQLLIACFVLWRGNPRDENHFFLAMHDKVQRMDQTQGPRLFLVGGSNVAFSIDSEALDGIGHTPINLGLNAGLGLDFYLGIVEERVRQGDIIVLIPEYELLSAAPSPSLQQSFAGICPELAKYLDLASEHKSWKYRMDHEALTTFHAWVHKAFQSQKESRCGVYYRQAFNEDGDMVAHRSLPRQGAISDSAVEFDPKMVRASLARLNAFARFCREQGAEVDYSYPPMPQERFAKSQAALAQFRELLDQELQVAQIDEPSDHVYESDQFFDTNYHLRGQAVADQTMQLRKSLESSRRAKNRDPLKTATTGHILGH